MSMYDIVFGGPNPNSDLLLGTLGMTKEDVGRFRDCFISEGEIAVYTRNGGGNREHYDEETEKGDSCHCTGCTITYQLPKHPCYLSDKDDNLDYTYATVFFKFPEEFKDELKKLDRGEKFDPDERWATAFSKMKAGENPEALERGRPMMEALMKVIKDQQEG